MRRPPPLRCAGLRCATAAQAVGLRKNRTQGWARAADANLRLRRTAGGCCAALLTLPLPDGEAHKQGHNCSCRLYEHNWRPGIRRHPAARALHTTGTLPLSRHYLRPESPADTPSDGPTGRSKSHADACAGEMPAHEQCRCSRRFDSPNWHAVPVDSEGGELSKSGIPGQHGSLGERQESCARYFGKNSLRNAEQTGRVAGYGAETRHSTGTSHHVMAGSAAGLQPGAQDPLYEGKRRRSAIAEAGSRTRSKFRHGVSRLAAVYGNLNEENLRATNARKAYDLRDKLSERLYNLARTKSKLTS